MQSKYGGWRGFISEGVDRKALMWWRDLTKVCGDHNEEKWFDSCMVWKVRNCGKMSFWHDRWIWEETLAYSYPRLFANLNQQDKVIGEVGFLEGDEWKWNLVWR